jgi:hypothetical protein
MLRGPARRVFALSSPFEAAPSRRDFAFDGRDPAGIVLAKIADITHPAAVGRQEMLWGKRGGAAVEAIHRSADAERDRAS